jgi:plasmid stabilization system protein ParE
MNYSFELRQEATKEFSDAFVWYEEQQAGLGKLFETKVLDKLNQICNNPFHYKVLYKKYHQALIETFPFLIIYTVSETDRLIIVMAIFHTSRNPKKKLRK